MNLNLSAGLIGSFRQYYAQVRRAAVELEAAGVVIKSPSIAMIVNPGDSYIRFDSDSPDCSDLLIQAATFDRLFTSDFVYVVAPEGYVGRATCYELGQIHARGIPVFYSEHPDDVPFGVPPWSIASPKDLAHQIHDPHSPLRNALRNRPGHPALDTASGRTDG